MANEMGKTIAQVKAEVDKCAWLCDYYKQYAPEFLSDKLLILNILKVCNNPANWTYTRYNAVEFSIWQVFRFAIPVLITGNGAILKHASNVQGCAFAIESLFLEAGFPDNIFRNISISGKNVKKRDKK